MTDRSRVALRDFGPDDAEAVLEVLMASEGYAFASTGYLPQGVATSTRTSILSMCGPWTSSRTQLQPTHQEAVR